jgi:formate hydrogenlyase subunit 6/NADH:ubiquinone oxidoreductase subunit I
MTEQQPTAALTQSPPVLPLTGKQIIIAKAGLQCIIDALATAGYTVIGPTVRQGAIVYEEIGQVEELPVGWTDEQGPGHYRLRERGDGRLFGFVVGPHTWKKYLYPPRLSLFRTSQNGNGFEFDNGQEAPQYAFIGARACELAAIAIQDRIFLEGPYQDPHYKARRERAFILAVNCTEPAATCFCHSMGTGPASTTGFDLSLTELDDTFLLTVGSDAGAGMLSGCNWRPAGAYELNQAKRLLDQAAEGMGRALQTDDLPGLLYDNLEHSRWDETAKRCLSCMNCTMVCPTCFCVDVQDVSDLTGKHTERVRVWDSCFNPDFSYVHGGNMRPTIRARYRQWLTHKLGSWVDQFGSSGCVGCGRCITWCPVGIDLTEEVAAIRGEQLS